MFITKKFYLGNLVTEFIRSGYLHGVFCCSTQAFPIIEIQKLNTIDSIGYTVDIIEEDGECGSYYKFRVYQNQRDKKIYWFIYPQEDGDVNIGPFTDFDSAAQCIDSMIADFIDDNECVWDINDIIVPDILLPNTPVPNDQSISYILNSRLRRIRNNRNG